MAKCSCHRLDCPDCYPENDGTYECKCGQEDCTVCNP